MTFRFLCSLLVAVAAAAQTDHVVLISVDGFRPDFYLDNTWPAPTIQYMAENGAKAERVRGVFPSVTYPSHTTMITGVQPGKHGVYYNEPFEPEGQSGRWYWEESAIQVPTLWDALRSANRKTAAVSWPVTDGAPIDWFIPEVWSLEQGGDRLAPMRDGTRPQGLWQELEREATGALNAQTYSASYMARDLETGAAAAYLLETKKPALLALHLIGTDHFQHEVGREGPIPRRALGTADAAINAVMEGAQRGGILERTSFIITGDHGFVDIHTSVAPNVWLTEAEIINEHGWRARFHTAGGSAFLRLRDPNDTQTAKQVRAILDDQPARIKQLFRVLDRDALDAAGADPEASLALTGSLGVTFSSRGEGDVLAETSGGTHGYFPTDFPEIYTGFVGYGPGFREGVTVHEMGLDDIAPIVAQLLGIEFPSADGVAPLGVLASTN